MWTILMLLCAGLFGILTHNLIKIDKILRATGGEFQPKQFFKLEWASIGISICVVVVSLMARTAIEELEAVGKWLAVGFFAIGLASQSVAYALKGRAEKFINTPPAGGDQPRF